MLSGKSLQKLLNRRIILSVSLGLVLFTVIYQVYFKIDAPKEILISQDQILKEDLYQIETWWLEGDKNKSWISGEMKCESLLGEPEQTNLEFTRCNPDFLQCLFEHQKIQLKTISLLPQANKKIYRQSINQKISHITLDIVALGEKYQIELVDRCHQVSLPEKRYASGAYDKKKNDFVFDTNKIPLNLDQFLVTNRDVREWKKELAKKPLSHPASHLTLAEQEKYCQFRGKQLAQSLYFDAASFYWASKEADFKSSTNRFAYPSNDRSYPLKKFLDGIVTFDLSYCSHLRSMECASSEKYKSFETQVATWSGLFDVMGGEFESLYNSFDPKLNLKTSSIHFLASHQFMRLGARSYWDGKDFKKENFHWRLLHEQKNKTFPVAFRCMQYQDPLIKHSGTGKDLFLAQSYLLSPYVNSESKMTEPVATTQLIAAFKTNEHIYNFFYRIPYKSELGELFITKEKAQTLDENIFFEMKNIIWKKKMRPFQVFFKDEDFKHQMYQFYQHQLIFLEENSEPIAFNFYNLTNDKGRALYLDSNLKNVGIKKIELKSNELNYCHKLRDDCSNELNDICDQCPGAWYPVVYGQCKKAYSKVCGVERCGGKDEPACPRSFDLAEENPKGVCFAGSQVGFCQQGLETSCEDNLLTCL